MFIQNRKEKMKNTVRNIIVLVSLIFIVCGFAGCYEPSPLYGDWQDNAGNEILFSNDGTFSAQIKNGTSTDQYSGTYDVIDNIIQLKVLESAVEETYTIRSEWDVRGSILYLIWKNYDSTTEKMELYHVARG